MTTIARGLAAAFICIVAIALFTKYMHGDTTIIRAIWSPISQLIHYVVALVDDAVTT